MNPVSRLSFFFLSIISLSIFAYGFTSSGKLSDGQSLMAWSLVPASLTLFVGAFYTKEHENEVIAVVLMLIGVFFALVCFGMHKQTGRLGYGIFSWVGLMLCGTAVGMVALDTIPFHRSFTRR